MGGVKKNCKLFKTSLTCPKTDFTMGCRLESYSDEVTLSLLDARPAAAVRTGPLVPVGSELDKLEKDPVMTLFPVSKKKAASSVGFCLECDGVGEALLSCRPPPC